MVKNSLSRPRPLPDILFLEDGMAISRRMMIRVTLGLAAIIAEH